MFLYIPTRVGPNLGTKKPMDSVKPQLMRSQREKKEAFHGGSHVRTFSITTSTVFAAQLGLYIYIYVN